MGQRGRSNLRKESGIQEEVWIQGVPPPFIIRTSLNLKATYSLAGNSHRRTGTKTEVR